MTIAFQLTIDDHREATGGHAVARTSSRWLFSGLVLMGAAFAMAMSEKFATHLFNRAVLSISQPIFRGINPFAIPLLFATSLFALFRGASCKPKLQYIDLSAPKFSKYVGFCGQGRGKPSWSNGRIGVRISAAKLTLATDLITVAYKWRAFVRFVETKNLFLLYNSEKVFTIIPKRAFASDEDIGTFRGLIREWAQSQAKGFPVIPPLATRRE